VAKIFAKKFDIISPVWLQIVKQSGAYAVAGTHDIDAGWLTDVRRKGKIQQQPQIRTVKGAASVFSYHEYLLYVLTCLSSLSTFHIRSFHRS